MRRKGFDVNAGDLIEASIHLINCVFSTNQNNQWKRYFITTNLLAPVSEPHVIKIIWSSEGGSFIEITLLVFLSHQAVLLVVLKIMLLTFDSDKWETFFFFYIYII